MPRERSFATRHPHLLEDWHPTRNGYLAPYTIAPNSVRKVWWRCRYCSRPGKPHPRPAATAPKAAPPARNQEANNNDDDDDDAK